MVMVSLSLPLASVTVTVTGNEPTSFGPALIGSVPGDVLKMLPLALLNSRPRGNVPVIDHVRVPVPHENATVRLKFSSATPSKLVDVILMVPVKNRVRARVAVCNAASVTWTVKVALVQLFCVGMPLNTPFALNVRPAGSGLE